MRQTDRETSDVRQIDVRQKHCLMPRPRGGGIIINDDKCDDDDNDDDDEYDDDD